MNDLIKQEFDLFILNGQKICNKLSKREREVVFLVLKGSTNREIGDVLYISETTVKKHVYNIYNKLQINSRFQLLTYHFSSNELYKAC